MSKKWLVGGLLGCGGIGLLLFALVVVAIVSGTSSNTAQSGGSGGQEDSGEEVKKPGSMLPSALGGRPTSEEVVQAFQAEGLEVGTYYPVEEEREDGTPSPLPKTYAEGTRFTIPSLKEAAAPPPIEPPPPPPKLKGPDGRPLPESQQPKAPEMPEMPEIPGDVGGRVFVFDSQHDLETMRNYYENGMPHMFGMSTHLYEEGLVLVQINDQLPKDEADKYGEVLKKVA